MGTAVTSERQIARFWSKVDRSGGADACWPFTGARTERGYGRIYFSGELWITSRLAHFLAGGEELGDQFACHSCDNPSCCNPKHLFKGDQAANVADCIAKGRFRLPPTLGGASNPRTKLNQAIADAIRHRRSRGGSRQDIAASFNISVGSVKRVLSGRRLPEGVQ
ncbi:MAG: hypothetical protein JWQ16_2474 [Novosphingobium sp.]|nr:hypothetical protein [Novosphingobium sp.]